MHMLFVQQIAGIVNDLLRQSQSAADIERVAAARHAHQQTVRRKQRIRIELHAGVFHAFAAKRKGLQLTVMGCHHSKYALLRQVIQNGHGQCSAFIRIRTGTDLIHQHQVPLPHLLKNAYQVHHMAGECGKALLNTLLVPDIRIYRPEHGKLNI